MPLEQAGIDAAQRAFGITLSGDSVKDNDTIQQALSGATAAQKATFMGVRYGGGTDAGARAYVDETFNLHSPITQVKTPTGSVSLDDPSVAWSRSYWDGINASRAEVAAGFDDLLANGFSGRPTVDPNDTNTFGEGSFRTFRLFSSNTEIRPPGEISRMPGDDDISSGGGDGGGGEVPRTGFRGFTPRDRTLEDYGGSIPRNPSVPTVLSTGGGTGGGGTGDGGTDTGSGTGSSGGSNGSGSGAGGAIDDDAKATDNAIQRLIDFASGQFAAGGGGSAGGVVGLPSDVGVVGGGEAGGTSKAALFFILIGGGILAWWLWKRFKKKQ